MFVNIRLELTKHTSGYTDILLSGDGVLQNNAIGARFVCMNL